MIRISKAGLFFLSACFSLFLKYLKGTDSVREVRDPHLTVQGSQLVEMGEKETQNGHSSVVPLSTARTFCHSPALSLVFRKVHSSESSRNSPYNFASLHLSLSTHSSAQPARHPNSLLAQIVSPRFT